MKPSDPLPLATDCSLTRAKYPAHIGVAKLVPPYSLAVQASWSAQT